VITHLLDTNAVIALLGQKSDVLVGRVRKSAKDSIGLSAVVAHELYFGAYGSARVAFNLETLRLAMADFPFVAFDRDDAQMSGEIGAALTAKGRPIGPCDVLIAGQAKARNLVLVTNNTGEFERVDGLRIEDWTVGG
jgi:tRNA(fMet)-specific endonuclease VapC